MPFSIALPDETLRQRLLRRIEHMARPPGSLGQLEALALQTGLVQHSLQPAIRLPQILIFAGDHGAIASGISAAPQKLTWQTMEAIVAGQAPISIACQQAALALSVVDAGVSHDFPARHGLINAKIEHGTANYVLEPAMWRSQLERALEYGRQLAHRLAAEGCNALGLGAMAVGGSGSAALLTHCLSDIPLEALTGYGADDEAAGRAQKLTVLQRALARAGRISDPLDALREYGGFETAMLTGAMLGAAEKRMLVLVDGFIVTSALIAALHIEPALRPYCVFAGHSRETGHAPQLEYLQARPLLDLGLALGEGSGPALAFPLLRTAVALLRESGRSEDSGIGRGHP